MVLKNDFIKATEEYNTFEKNVPAYYFRRAFTSAGNCTAKITIAVCGFYELYFNGVRITKGFLSPYISNTNDFIYYDEYSVTLEAGENVVAVWLGNGFQNNLGGYIWDFDKADFRSAPMFAVSITQGQEILLKSDTNFKIAPSPIRSDDYRFGEYYDANYQIEGWNQQGFDDANWKNALPATAPKGQLRLAGGNTLGAAAAITDEPEAIPFLNGWDWKTSKGGSYGTFQDQSGYDLCGFSLGEK